MDFEGDHFLKCKYCQFDGNQKRVKKFVLLTASVYYPFLQKQLVLATLNCKHEDSKYIAEFLRKFNEAIREVNTTEKKFWSCELVTNMASSNSNGLATPFMGKAFFQWLMDASFILSN